jgi:hypothetical protein
MNHSTAGRHQFKSTCLVLLVPTCLSAAKTTRQVSRTTLLASPAEATLLACVMLIWWAASCCLECCLHCVAAC